VSDPSDRWEAWLAVPDGIQHAQATVQGSPEDAVRAAMARAVQKYGPQAWERWRMRAELLRAPPVAVTVYFEWRDGTLARIPRLPDRGPPTRSRRRGR
jgi:hypothetical protein